MESEAELLAQLYRQLVRYLWWIGGSLGLAVVGIVIMLATPRNTAVPCFWYGSNTPATTVSAACLQAIWDGYCIKRPYTFPAEYAGWWRSSPNGAAMIRCSPLMGLTLPACGVGTYGNIVVYMASCNAMYGRVL